MVPLKRLQAVAQPHPTIDTRRVTIESDNSSTNTLSGTFGAGNVADRCLCGKPLEEQVVEARQFTRAAPDLVTHRGPLKHNNPPVQIVLAFDQVLADPETKLLQQYRLLQGTLTQIVKRDWIATLKFNLSRFINIYDTIYKIIITGAPMDATEQGNLLKTQPYTVIRPVYNNQMLRSLRALLQTERAHPASVDPLLIRIIGFTGELDQKLKKLTAKQVIDLIRSKPEIMIPECAQDFERKPTSKTKLTVFYHCYVSYNSRA
ncbi:MAG: hypothetical protein EZS28_001300 [Streblomastix strix]|uniref:Uncharacterized protein n=1 Tax=Streblomastix strix TaxID=222440 RepID=A0A5J4X7M4_9EUKA|nr:MAG: hypothetical protein EZS28_001300 [Streblomastix strix]